MIKGDSVRGEFVQLNRNRRNKVTEDAFNCVGRAAPNAKKEVDKKAQVILDEANKKADQVLINAKAESDKKLQ